MTTRAAILVEVGRPLVVEDVELREPGAHEVIVRMRRIHSCQFGGAHIRRDIPRFEAMLAAGTLDAEPLITRRFTLDEANEALAAALGREVLTGVLLPGA